MPEFCSGVNSDTINDSNYNDSFSGKSCLPALGNGDRGFSSFNRETGIVPEAAISSWIHGPSTPNLLTLEGASWNSAVAPSEIDGSMTSPSRYATNAAALKTSIQNEYCFYYVRYIWALTEVLHMAATGPLSNADKNTTDSRYNTLKRRTIALNSKLIQIIQVLKGLTDSRGKTLETYYGSNSGVNLLNSQLDTTRESLMRHMGKLEDKDMETGAKTAMMEYTIEKNNSSRNMLAVYGFMNIFAIGMLFYLYQGSK